MKTALYDRHCALGARMVSFAGWEMPIYYKGVVIEHHIVRNAVGLFDVSHMGRILVEGQEAEAVLDELSTNQIVDRPDGSATYTVWCHPEKGCVDDVMVYKHHPSQFFVVVNASNRQKDLNHLVKYSEGRQVNIRPLYEGHGILALQGPFAEPLLSQFVPEIKALKTMRFIRLEEDGQEIIVSRTGYTGAGGFEIYGSDDLIVKWWDRLLKEGTPFGIAPIGLGARDTLRLEMGFALYGHELDDSISANESVAAWTIKWNKSKFVGKEALEQLEHGPNKRFAYGIRLINKGIAREGFPVLKDQKRIGLVTSGTFSPTLNESIALILVNMPLQIGDSVYVQIRQQLCQAEVVELPFVRKQI